MEERHNHPERCAQGGTWATQKLPVRPHINKHYLDLIREVYYHCKYIEIYVVQTCIKDQPVILMSSLLSLEGLHREQRKCVCKCEDGAPVEAKLCWCVFTSVPPLNG